MDMPMLEHIKSFEDFVYEKMDTKEILDKIRHYRSNTAELNDLIDQLAGKNTYPYTDIEYNYPERKRVKGDKLSYQKFDGLLKKTENEKKNESETKPSIFRHTVYRLPKQEELEEFKNYPDLTYSDIVNGFGYTIIGRGISNAQNKKMIENSISLLCSMYPENEQYRKALILVKENHDAYCEFGCNYIDEFIKKNPSFSGKEFEEYVIQHNRADRDSGELQDISREEIIRLAKEFKPNEKIEESEKVTLNVRIENLDTSTAEDFLKMFRFMEWFGDVGTSRGIHLFCDGDGHFRPKITVDGHNLKKEIEIPNDFEDEVVKLGMGA